MTRLWPGTSAADALDELASVLAPETSRAIALRRAGRDAIAVQRRRDSPLATTTWAPPPPTACGARRKWAGALDQMKRAVRRRRQGADARRPPGLPTIGGAWRPPCDPLRGRRGHRLPDAHDPSTPPRRFSTSAANASARRWRSKPSSARAVSGIPRASTRCWTTRPGTSTWSPAASAT